MIEQIVAGEILLPPSDPVGPPPQKPNRFDQPPSKQILRLEEELRQLRTKFTQKESELEEVKRAAGNLLEETIKEIQNKANDEIHRLQTELAAANRKIELIAAVGENMQKTKNDRIDRMEADHKQQMEKLKQDADKVLNERLNALQADNEKEIQKLLDERKELISKLSPPLVTESVTQTDEFPQPNASNLAEVDTQTEEERPDSAPPIPDEFPDDSRMPLPAPRPHKRTTVPLTIQTRTTISRQANNGNYRARKISNPYRRVKMMKNYLSVSQLKFLLPHRLQ